MDGSKFDALTKGFATGRSRRSLLKGLVGGGAALLATQHEGALARRRVQPKTTICHLDAETGQYVELQVTQSEYVTHFVLHPGDYAGACEQCVPATCAQFDCGERQDGCGGTIDCGCCTHSDCGVSTECVTHRCQRGMCLTGSQASVDCQYGEWSEWSACSVECDTGIVTRTREILVQGSCGGVECDESTLVEQAPCTMQPCDCGPEPTCQPGECGHIFDGCGNTVDFCIDRSVTCPPGYCGPLRDRCGTQVSYCVDRSVTCSPGACGPLYDACNNQVGDCGPCED